MALPGGGDGDKRGNSYEADFGVRLILDVLLGHRPFVQPEPASKTLEVVDFTSELNGFAECYQCKARAPGGTWTWNRLSSILSRMLKILRSDENARCYLITQSPADGLDSLTLDAEQRLITADEFFARVNDAGEKRKDHYKQFCSAAELDPSSQDDAIVSQQVLGRISFGPYNDRLPVLDHYGPIRLIFNISESEIASLVASLRQLTVDQRGVRLTEVRLRKILERQGFRFRQDVPETVVEQIKHRREAFLQRVGRNLIADTVITPHLRPELVDHFRGAEQHAVITGSKGIGKTVLVMDAVEQLTEAGFLVLPISLDDIALGESARDLSNQLGFRGSIVACLQAARKASADPSLPAILVLDQLDAIRWTTQHATSAVRVIDQIVEEIEAAGSEEVCLVTACRKFDLETDASIKRILDRLKYREFRVEKLSLEAVLESCQAVGRSPSSDKQIDLLSTPIHLSHWHEIVASQSNEAELAFSTPLQLFQRVWLVRRKAVESELGSSIAAERDNILENVRRHLEGGGQLAAPRSLLGRNESLAHAMQTHGLVVAINKHQIKFPHQTDLEYLIAEAAAEELTTSGGRVAAWLGDRSNQSLFRREPLRLLLELIITEHGGDPRPFVEELLESNDVRYHMKLTAIAALRKLGGTTECLSYISELAANARWSKTVLSMVVRLRPDATNHLLESRQYAGLLEGQKPDNEAAKCLLSTIRDHADVAEKIIEADDHLGLDEDLVRQIIFDVDLILSSELLFTKRLEFIRSGISRDYYDWGTLSNRSPRRAVQLVASHYEKAINEQKKTDRSVHHRLDMDRLFDDETLGNTAEKVAESDAWFVWQTLFPILKARQRWVEKARGGRAGHWIDHTVPKEVSAMLVAAGRRLAATESDEILGRFRMVVSSGYRAMFRLILGSLENLPAAHADAGIEMLLSSNGFLWCGERETETGPEPAAATIRKLSGLCSDKQFRRLEDRLCSYTAPWEIDVYRREMDKPSTKRGGEFVGRYLGQSKYVLLSALDAKRISPQTASVLGCLRFRFPQKDPSQPTFQHSRGTFGTVTPSISSESAKAMTDADWTRLVTTGMTPKRTYRVDSNTESSPELFAQRLYEVGVTNPLRFVQLATTWPLESLNVHYVEAILRVASIDLANRSLHRSDGSGPPAESEETINILRRTKPSMCIANATSQESVRYWFDVLRYRIDLRLPKDLIDELVHHAEDDSPADNETSYFGSGDDENETYGLYTVALNSVRGHVCSAIQGVLTSEQPHHERLLPTLERLLSDPHPGVVMMAIEAARPCIADGNETVIRAVCDAIVREPLAGAANNVPEFLWWLGGQYSEWALECFDAMLQSDSAEAQKEAAELVAFHVIIRMQWHDKLDACLAGTIPMRAGVGEAIKEIVESAGGENEYEIDALSQTIWNDESADVRLAATPHWTNVRLDDVNSSTLQTYVSSATFRDDADSFIYRLKDADPVQHEALILDICRQFITHRGDIEIEPGSAAYYVIGELVPLLLRLYELATAASRDQILDAFDELLESEAIPAFGLLHRLEERL